jgi:cytochrome b6-f complex iron-sulfur subunit
MPEGRRGLLQWILGGGLAASIGTFLYPLLRFMEPPEMPEASVNEASGGKVTDLKPNSGKIVKFGSQPVLLIRVSESEWRAFSAVCTHLGCIVQYEAQRHQIWCACHNGLYDLNGRVVSGPPPRPLEPYDVRLRGDEVIVTHRA